MSRGSAPAREISFVSLVAYGPKVSHSTLAMGGYSFRNQAGGFPTGNNWKRFHVMRGQLEPVYKAVLIKSFPLFISLHVFTINSRCFIIELVVMLF